MKRYELNFRKGTLSLYLNGNSEPANVYSFANGDACRRNVIRLWSKVIERGRFRMEAPTAEGAWVYVGWAA